MCVFLADRREQIVLVPGRSDVDDSLFDDTMFEGSVCGEDCPWACVLGDLKETIEKFWGPTRTTLQPSFQEKKRIQRAAPCVCGTSKCTLEPHTRKDCTPT